MKTATVKELIKFLQKMPEDMQVYMSSDEEGNNYHGTSVESGFEVCKDDNVLIFYPCGGYLEFDEIAPKEYNKEEE